MPRTQPSRAAGTVTPKSRNGMVESLRVLKACRKTAVAARRFALQMIHNTIVCAPEDLREMCLDLRSHHPVRGSVIR